MRRRGGKKPVENLLLADVVTAPLPFGHRKRKCPWDLRKREEERGQKTSIGIDKLLLRLSGLLPLPPSSPFGSGGQRLPVQGRAKRSQNKIHCRRENAFLPVCESFPGNYLAVFGTE